MTKYKSTKIQKNTKNDKNPKNPKNVKSTKSTKKNSPAPAISIKKQNRVKQQKYKN